MRDFTTTEYIEPIVDALLKDHEVVDLTEYGLGVRLKEKRGEHPKSTLIRNNEGKIVFFSYDYFHVDEYVALRREMLDWAIAVETYPGELDTWVYREYDRIDAAVGKMLLERSGL